MIDGNVLVLLERYAIQTVRQSEDAVDDVPQLKVGPEHFSVQIVFLHLQLVRIEPRIPRFHLVHIFVCQFAQLVAFLNSRGLVGINQVVQQAIDAAGIRCHAALQHIVGIGLVAQQLGNFATQIDETLAYLKVIFAILVCTEGIACHVELLPQLALGRVGHEGRE